MNKAKVIEKLKEKTQRSEAECIIINDILYDHCVVGKNNKEKIVADFMEKLNISAEEADELYNICAEIIVTGIFKRK